jgi:hypothetical protein
MYDFIANERMYVVVLVQVSRYPDYVRLDNATRPSLL